MKRILLTILLLAISGCSNPETSLEDNVYSIYIQEGDCVDKAKAFRKLYPACEIHIVRLGDEQHAINYYNRKLIDCTQNLIVDVPEGKTPADIAPLHWGTTLRYTLE